MNRDTLGSNPEFDIISSFGNGAVQHATTGEYEVLPFNRETNDPKYPGNSPASTQEGI